MPLERMIRARNLLSCQITASISFHFPSEVFSLTLVIYESSRCLGCIYTQQTTSPSVEEKGAYEYASY